MIETTGRHLLLVEDEKNIALTLLERLKMEGFTVVWKATTAAALEAIRDDHFDLALLDVGLPDGNGFDVAGALRKKSPSTSIVFLTAFGNPEDRVRGLELGAEDYVVKPFHLKELLLRIRNALKRAELMQSTSLPEEVQVGKARIRFSSFEASVGDTNHPLTHKECALLKLLVERRGQVVSRDDILNEVWSDEDFPSARTVDNFIVRLRRLVEENPEKPSVIRSIRGVGYQLT